MALAFDCADPVTGALVKLNGAGAYQAAVHCAAVSAAKRLAGWSRQQRAAAAAAAAAELAAGVASAAAAAAAPALAAGEAAEWPPLPTREGPAPAAPTTATAATACTPSTDAGGLTLPRRISERGTSQDSETGVLGCALDAALAAGGGGGGGAAAAASGLAPHRRRGATTPPPPAGGARPNDDVRRALAHMTASLKRLHAAAAAAAAAADAAGRAAGAAGAAPSSSSTSTSTAQALQRATVAAGVDPAALRSLQARVVGLLRAMPRPTGGAAVQQPMGPPAGPRVAVGGPAGVGPPSP